MDRGGYAALKNPRHDVTPQQMVQALLGGGVAISNVHLSGAAVAGGTFSGSEAAVGFERGIILSSGAISNVIGPNTSIGISHSNVMPGDDQLTALVVPDAAVLEFDFVPNTATVSFQYVFASE